MFSPKGRVFTARYGGKCSKCERMIQRGDVIGWNRADRTSYHIECDIKLLPAVTLTSQGAIERGLAGPNADKWASVLRRMALLADPTWGKAPKAVKCG